MTGLRRGEETRPGWQQRGDQRIAEVVCRCGERRAQGDRVGQLDARRAEQPVGNADPLQRRTDRRPVRADVTHRKPSRCASVRPFEHTVQELAAGVGHQCPV
jgi:hypothetical protein